MRTIQIDGDGIVWSGLHTSVCLTALSQSAKGEELEVNFKELARTKETINFAVSYPEQMREGTGFVESFADDGESVTVSFTLDSNVTVQIFR